ncbi:DUF5988 family protein [Streptomyces malaysiensis]|uniref:DUF5988 family protein n=1 Tax=Streptomyces malaysiensis TaxID=92644 RepID=UPI00371BDDDD
MVQQLVEPLHAFGRRGGHHANRPADFQHIGSGYEHFVHQGDYATVDGEELPVFRWTARTAIAE